MTKDEALKLAHEALKKFHYAMIDAGVLDRQEVLNEGFTADTAIKEALALPQRTWVGLTRKEFAEIFCDDRWRNRPELMMLQVQAKLKQKNGYAEEKNT